MHLPHHGHHLKPVHSQLQMPSHRKRQDQGKGDKSCCSNLHLSWRRNLNSIQQVNFYFSLRSTVLKKAFPSIHPPIQDFFRYRLEVIFICSFENHFVTYYFSYALCNSLTNKVLDVKLLVTLLIRICQ